MSGNFVCMGRSNPWGDLDQMRLVGRYRGRNHVCNISWLSVKGCGCGERGTFAFSHWLEVSPLQHWSRVTVRSWPSNLVKFMVPFESLCTVSFSPSIVTLALSCIISEIQWDIGRKSWFFSLSAFDAPVRVVPEYCHTVTVALPRVTVRRKRQVRKKTRMVWLPDSEKSLKIMFSRFDRTTTCDRQTNRQTDGRTDGRLATAQSALCRASRSKDRNKTAKNNVKNFHGSLTTVVRAQNDTSQTANITDNIFDRTYWYSSTVIPATYNSLSTTTPTPWRRRWSVVSCGDLHNRQQINRNY